MPPFFYFPAMNRSFKPITAVPARVALAGVCGAIFVSLLIWLLELPAPLEVLLFLSGCALPMWTLELRRFPGNGSRSGKLGLPAWRRKLRLVGLISLMAMFCLNASIFRVLSPAAFAGFEALLPLILCCATGWMCWMGLRFPAERELDSVEFLGKSIIRFLMRSSKFGRSDSQIILGWAVKSFFLPLMISSTYLFLVSARNALNHQVGWMSIFGGLYMLMFAIDTAFATIGYCSTSKRIGAHIRSTEATFLGWCSALVCYPPLNLLVLQKWLPYRDGLEWDKWLAGWPLISFLWGIAILLSVGLYVSATVAFGLRFSNLTNRGVITSGPYQYFKHPSYIGKNVAWWLISVPFVSSLGVAAAIGNCMALLAINGIYCIRAATEERHLMEDPAYQAYSDWISRNGVLGRVCRAFRATPAAMN